MSEISTIPLRRPTRGDVISLAIFMITGAAIAVWSVVAAVLRIIEVAPNRDVEVFAPFAGTVAQAPIGRDGALVPVALESAVLTAPELPIASVVALVMQPIVGALAVIIVITCLLALSANIIRGRVFGRANTTLVTIAGLVALVGLAGVPFLGNMGANGAFAWISDRTFDNVILSVDPFPFIGLAFVAALASTVFTVGDRIQRDTEGLV